MFIYLFTLIFNTRYYFLDCTIKNWVLPLLYYIFFYPLSFIVFVQSLSCFWLFVTPWTEAQASLSITISQSLLKLMSIESVMPSNHLVLCHPHLLLPSIFPSIRDFSNELAPTSSGQCIGASASVLTMKIQAWFPLGLTGLISLMSKYSQESSLAPQFEIIHSSALNLLYIPAITFIHDYWKNYSFDYTDFCWQSDISAF